jgi:hypothetical protein
MKNIQNSDHQLTGAADICITERSLILTRFYPIPAYMELVQMCSVST